MMPLWSKVLYSYIPRPGPQHPQPLEPRDTVRQGRPDQVVEQVVVDVQAVVIGCVLYRWGDAAEIEMPFGPHEHPAGVEDERAVGELLRAVEHEHAALARLNRYAQPGHGSDLRAP